ncbi:unnamed protein product, partial [Ectocarpus sp. 12 AP-2014]
QKEKHKKNTWFSFETTTHHYTPRGTLLPHRSPQPTCREAHEAANPATLRKTESAAGRRQEKVLLLSCFVLVVISID